MDMMLSKGITHKNDVVAGGCTMLTGSHVTAPTPGIALHSFKVKATSSEVQTDASHSMLRCFCAVIHIIGRCRGVQERPGEAGDGYMPGDRVYPAYPWVAEHIGGELP